jgi:hypothetical protein
MTEHVERICRDADIWWQPYLRRVDSAHCIALTACEQFDIPREIVTAPIRSVFSYATALHEIGHYLGRRQRSKNSMTREREAWNWARANALIWTEAVERYAARALATCEKLEAQRRRKFGREQHS